MIIFFVKLRGYSVKRTRGSSLDQVYAPTSLGIKFLILDLGKVRINCILLSKTKYEKH